MKLDRSKLIRAREMLGYGVEKTAEEAGVSKNSVLRAEHEEDIRPVTARKIAAALGVRVADLIGESGTGKAERFRIRVQPSGAGPSVTREDFEERGMSVTDDEVRGVNLYLDGLYQGKKSGGPAAIIGVEESAGVDEEKVRLLVEFVLSTPGFLTLEEKEAIGKGIRAKLEAVA